MGKEIKKGARKTTHKLNAAWDYEFEERDLNEMSAKGWHAYKNNGFTQKYEYDKDVRYIYRLDYQLKPDTRYFEMFEDSGWEVITEGGGWITFRKLYDASLPESEYIIYSDIQSRNDMLKRWRITSTIILFLLGFNSYTLNILDFSTQNGFPFADFCLLTAYILLAIIAILGIISINRMIKGKKNKHRFPFTACLVIVIIALSMFFILSFASSWAHGLGILAGILTVVVIVSIISLLSQKKHKQNNKL